MMFTTVSKRLNDDLTSLERLIGGLLPESYTLAFERVLACLITTNGKCEWLKDIDSEPIGSGL